MMAFKQIFSSACGLALLFVGGVAQAEIVTYEFTATITGDNDPNDELSIGTGAGQESTITGTFSYDTEATVRPSDSFPFDDGSTKYSTGEVVTDQVTTAGEGSSSDFTRIEDGTSLLLETFSIYDFSSTIDGLSDGVQQVSFSGDDVLTADTLPGTLSLEDFNSVRYAVRGRDETGASRSVIATINSLTKVESSSVPELSAQGMVTSVSLLAGAAFILTSRRRQDKIAQG